MVGSDHSVALLALFCVRELEPFKYPFILVISITGRKVAVWINIGTYIYGQVLSININSYW